MYSREDVELALEGLAEGMSVREVCEMVGARRLLRPGLGRREAAALLYRGAAPAREGHEGHRCPARGGRVP